MSRLGVESANRKLFPTFILHTSGFILFFFTRYPEPGTLYYTIPIDIILHPFPPPPQPGRPSLTLVNKGLTAKMQNKPNFPSPVTFNQRVKSLILSKYHSLTFEYSPVTLWIIAGNRLEGGPPANSSFSSPNLLTALAHWFPYIGPGQYLPQKRLIYHNARHSFNSARMIFDFRGKVINVCHIEIYDAGRFQGCARFWAELKVKIARSRCAVDGSG